jgi:predicted nuclease with TOPRIM domain
MSADQIEFMLQSVKEIMAENEKLLNKVKVLEEKVEIASDDIRHLKTDVTVLECEEDDNPITKKEMCEHIEEVINSIYPLQDGWRAVYSEEQECMGYYDSSDRLYNDPPDYLFWDRSRWMKKPVITIS